ncbi:AP2 domain transcription factor AP2VIII-2 [Babesia caballi]|uniref:AP2 domain transcription factor AP2VIII-2 n=1 Tax=Babesia caballi TaxID=5871 RepID=A0AAV4LN27_BABCB|nr:AP2 domain transcription factor AP2VIII-2 [Babesia caballi]
MAADQGQRRRECASLNQPGQIMSSGKLQLGPMSQNTQQSSGGSASGSYEQVRMLDGDVYSNGTELYMDNITSDRYAPRPDIYGQEQVATPKDHVNISQLGGARGSYILSQIATPKEQPLHFAGKYGGIIGYNKPQKAEQYGGQPGYDFYLPPAHLEPSQGGLGYGSWDHREYDMYHEGRGCGNESINSTVDGDSIDDIDDLVGPDGTLPPANKRDPIYTAISGLKWKAKSKKWVVRWDNPITNRRVYKYFSGIRYGFMGAHKRAKYYLEFLNASVGRLDAPSIGNPFCRRTEGPPKGKPNKGLIRKLISRSRAEMMQKPGPAAYGYGCQTPCSHPMDYDDRGATPVHDRPMYSYGSSVNDPYTLMDAAAAGY